MAQLMPLPLTVSSLSKIQIGFTCLVPAHPGSPGQRAVKRLCVCEQRFDKKIQNQQMETHHYNNIVIWCSSHQPTNHVELLLLFPTV